MGVSRWMLVLHMPKPSCVYQRNCLMARSYHLLSAVGKELQAL
jgi:hypothetical protein